MRDATDMKALAFTVVSAVAFALGFCGFYFVGGLMGSIGGILGLSASVISMAEAILLEWRR